MDYLSSLGKTQTAAVQRDADIGVAEAERDAGIRVCTWWLKSICLHRFLSARLLILASSLLLFSTGSRMQEGNDGH